MSLKMNFTYIQVYLVWLVIHAVTVNAEDCISENCTTEYAYNDIDYAQLEEKSYDSLPYLQCYECNNYKDCLQPRIVNCSLSRAEHTRHVIHTLLLQDYQPLEDRNRFFYKCITLDWQKRGSPPEVIKGCYYWQPQYNYSVRISAHAFCHKCHNDLCNAQRPMGSHIWRSLKQFVNNLFLRGELNRKLFARTRRPGMEKPLQYMEYIQTEEITTTTTTTTTTEAQPALPPEGIRGLQECF